MNFDYAMNLPLSELKEWFEEFLKLEKSQNV